MKKLSLLIFALLLAACSEENIEPIDELPTLVVTSYTLGNSTLNAYLESGNKIDNVTSKNGVLCTGVAKPDTVLYTDKFFDEQHLSYEAEAYFFENCGKEAEHDLSDIVSDHTKDYELQFNQEIDLTDSFNKWIQETREIYIDLIEGGDYSITSRINSAYLFGTDLINVSIKYDNGTVRNLGDYNIVKNEWHLGFSIEDPERYYNYEKANEPFELVYSTTYWSNIQYRRAYRAITMTTMLGFFSDFVESVHRKFSYFGTSEEYPPFLYEVGI